MSENSIKIKFLKWDKYNIRTGGIKRPIWFSFSNDFYSDPDLYGLTHNERHAMIYMLCETSRNNKSGELTVHVEMFSRMLDLPYQVLFNCVDKLLELNIISSSRTRPVRDPSSTLQDKTRQDRTGHNTLVVSSKQTETVKYDLESIYKAYPKRLGENRKKIGLVRLGKIISSQEDFDLAMKAVTNYTSHIEKTEKLGTEFVKQFASFWDSQGDWTEWAAIESTDSKVDWKTRMMEKLK